MSPYRQAPSPEQPLAPRSGQARGWTLRQALFLFIAVAAAAKFYFLEGPVYWLAIAGGALIIGVLPAAATDGKARLCRILWHCGERGTAFGVYIGWIPLRLSKKRMDRNARAVARFVQQRRRERYPWLKE
jgi:hypothetical protein